MELCIYYKDFDGNGSVDPILCYYINGISYPANSLDDLTEQLPALKKKFLEYKTYATATINNMFTNEQLKDAGLLKAEIMQTVYLENLGSKGFALRTLPIEAQYAPVYGIITTDINHDGKKDILLAGNNTWTRIKYGRYAANHGVVLLGDGKGGFTYAPQYKSGLNIRGNVKSMKEIKSQNSQNILVGINDSNAIMLKLN